MRYRYTTEFPRFCRFQFRCFFRFFSFSAARIEVCGRQWFAVFWRIKKIWAELRRELVTKSTSGGCDQFETSPDAIEPELRTALCERRQTDRLKTNYSIDEQKGTRWPSGLEHWLVLATGWSWPGSNSAAATSLRNFGITVYPAWPVSFGGYTKSRQSLLSVVYARGSKRSHQSALEMCNCRGLHHPL